ncbi:NUDIX hydrolase [Bacteroidia bacterium]|nr:NUDIX hydrolase [Bacteroidia bacterium]
MQEIWDIYDNHRKPTGETIMRGEPLGKDQFHLVVHVCVFNTRGEMLIQLRQTNKKYWKGKWDFSSGGAAISGEDSQTAAAREFYEELGLKIDLSNARPAITINFEEAIAAGFDDYYIIVKDIDIADIKPNPKEIQSLMWVSKEKIIQMIHEGEFIGFHDSFIDILFLLRNKKSMHIEDDGKR